MSGLEASDLAAISSRLGEIVRDGDLAVLTPKKVRQQLESEFGVDLSARKQWLKSAMANVVPDTSGKPKKTPSKKRKADEAPAVEDDESQPRLSDAMVAVVGVRHANHFSITKLLWQYIKKHDLQDAANKNYIVCDDKLRAVFGKDRLTSFEMAKLVGAHLFKDTAKSEKKAKKDTGYRGTPELAEFCGEQTNNRFTITKHLWAYIKAHELQDPNDKRRILFDDTLKQLFKCDETTSFKLAKLISTHFP